MTRYSTESFQRGGEIGRESCRLPARTYNLMRILLAQHGDCVFVPIRPMQYLAVTDAEEVIFVNSHARLWVEIAWQYFRPAARAALDEAVPYEAVYYRPEGLESGKRLQGEYQRALELLSERERPSRPGEVVALVRKLPTGEAG
jgi:hypothetical protein